MKDQQHSEWFWNKELGQYEGRDGVIIRPGYRFGVWEVRIPVRMKKGNYCTGFETTSLEEAMSEAYDHRWVLRAMK